VKTPAKPTHDAGAAHRAAHGLPRASGAAASPDYMGLASIALPFTSLALIGVLLVTGGTLNGILALVALVLLIATVFACVHNADVVAARVGEPLGTLVLTFAVTAIEVSIIASIMLHGSPNPTLAREAVFSVIMIVTTGIIGVCLLLGALRYREQEFRIRGTSAYLAVLLTLSVLVLVLPDFTKVAPAGYFSVPQLIFIGIASALLYGAFLFIQTVRNRTDFLRAHGSQSEPVHRRPSPRAALLSLLWLVIGVFAVALLAKKLSTLVEDTFADHHVAEPDAIVGAAVALLVLLPEAVSALKSAVRNDLQTSLNVALGSALATIGLTIPAVAIISLITGEPLVFGLDPRDAVLLVLALVLSIISFGTGRTNMLTGLVHLVLFATYILLLFEP
jgi:Ca2+:H+ antiporter